MNLRFGGVLIYLGARPPWPPPSDAQRSERGAPSVAAPERRTTFRAGRALRGRPPRDAQRSERGGHGGPAPTKLGHHLRFWEFEKWCKIRLSSHFFLVPNDLRRKHHEAQSH